MGTVIVILLLLLVVMVGAGIYFLMFKKDADEGEKARAAVASAGSVMSVTNAGGGRRLVATFEIDMNAITGNDPVPYLVGAEVDDGDDGMEDIRRFRDPNTPPEEKERLAESLRERGYRVTYDPAAHGRSAGAAAPVQDGGNGSGGADDDEGAGGGFDIATETDTYVLEAILYDPFQTDERREAVRRRLAELGVDVSAGSGTDSGTGGVPQDDGNDFDPLAGMFGPQPGDVPADMPDGVRDIDVPGDIGMGGEGKEESADAEEGDGEEEDEEEGAREETGGDYGDDGYYGSGYVDPDTHESVGGEDGSGDDGREPEPEGEPEPEPEFADVPAAREPLDAGRVIDFVFEELYDDEEDSRKAVSLMTFIAQSFRDGLLAPELVAFAQDKLHLRVNRGYWTEEQYRRAQQRKAVYHRDEALENMPQDEFALYLEDVVANTKAARAAEAEAAQKAAEAGSAKTEPAKVAETETVAPVAEVPEQKPAESAVAEMPAREEEKPLPKRENPFKRPESAFFREHGGRNDMMWARLERGNKSSR